VNVRPDLTSLRLTGVFSARLSNLTAESTLGAPVVSAEADGAVKPETSVSSSVALDAWACPPNR
jgi:hypothetical protein